MPPPPRPVRLSARTGPGGSWGGAAMRSGAEAKAEAKAPGTPWGRAGGDGDDGLKDGLSDVKPKEGSPRCLSHRKSLRHLLMIMMCVIDTWICVRSRSEYAEGKGKDGHGE